MAGIPLSWNDPIFSSVSNSASITVPNGGTVYNQSITDSGNIASIVGQGSFTIDQVRINSEEGVRIGGSGNMVINNSYIETTGVGADHADGIQAYSPGSTGNLTITNTTIVSHNTAATAGLFIADNWTGTINLNNVVIEGGPYGIRIHPDTGGDNHLNFTNVYFVGPFEYGAFIVDQSYGGHQNYIDTWDNVRYATIVNGVLVPGALIPSPLPVTTGGGGTTANPDLTESVSVVGSTTVASGASMTISAKNTNIGSGASPASTAGIYLSTDATITTSDTLLATVSSAQLAAGAVDTKNLSVTLPANLAAGTYYIGGIADYNNQVAETTEGNNNGNTVAITVGGGGGTTANPDLTESVSVVGSTTVASGASMTISATNTNIGGGASAASTAGIYLSTDATITTSDTLLATVSSAQLAAGAVDTKNLSVTLPANLAAGTYYIGGIADYNNQVQETTGGNNNGNTVAITVGGGGGTTAKPDLTESVSVVGSTTVASGASMTISATNTNIGGGASAASTAGIYLSTDATITTSDTLLATVSSAQLAAGAVDTKNLSVTLPANLAAGTYYIGGIADYNNQVQETTGGNNNGNTVAITVGGTPTDNLLYSDGGNNVLVGGANGAAGDTVSYANATAGVTVSLATTSPQNTVGAGIDTLSGFENLTGSNFYDMLTGTNGNNVLNGLGGSDTLIGLAGNDTLTGGGGRGLDTFVFDPGFGKDRITDFSTWRDVIQFSPDLFPDYSAVMASTHQVGADTVITFDLNNTVTLANVSASALSPTNFNFT